MADLIVPFATVSTVVTVATVVTVIMMNRFFLAIQNEVLFLQVVYQNGRLNAQGSVFEMVMMASTNSTAKLNEIEL